MGVRVFVAAGLLLAAFAAAPAPAQAATGAWRLDPRLCPDLVEDRLDRRVTRSRRDLREDRRDRRVVRCPVRAWVWTGPRYRVGLHPPRPVVTRITVRRGRYFYRPRRRAPLVGVRVLVRP